MYTIEDYQKMYKDAKAKGDADGMQKANQGANAIRKNTGQKEQHATVDINSVRSQQNTVRSQQSQSNNSGIMNSINKKLDSITGNDRGANIGGRYYDDAPSGMPDIDDYNLGLLNNSYSGRTLNDTGYGAYYKNRYDENVNRYNYYMSKGSNEIAQQFKNAIDEYEGGMGTAYQANNVFNKWDTGHLDMYIQNKLKYDKANATEREQLAKTNALLRQLYGLEEDKYTYNDLGQLGSDLFLGDFIKYGLDTEKGRDIPDITTSDMEINPKYEIARQMARSNNLFGYEPLGRLTGDSAEEHKRANYDEDEMFYNSVVNNIPYTPSNQRNNQYSDVANHIDSIITSSGGKSNGKTNVNDFIPMNDVNPNIGGIYETNNGRFVDYGGELIQLNEDEYINFMQQVLGF